MRLPLITSTSSAQTDGQSCGHTERRRATSRGAFIQTTIWWWTQSRETRLAGRISLVYPDSLKNRIRLELTLDGSEGNVVAAAPIVLFADGGTGDSPQGVAIARAATGCYRRGPARRCSCGDLAKLGFEALPRGLRKNVNNLARRRDSAPQRPFSPLAGRRLG